MITVGQRFGRLVVVERLGTNGVGKGGKAVARVRCDCGGEKIVRTDLLGKGWTRSCGCLRRERKTNLRHGEAAAETPEYTAWRSMISRCECSTWEGYHRYGGRGITVCDRWRASFEAFLADVGRRPSSKHSLDRVDVDGHYEPRNVRWATASQQANNRRSNVVVVAHGESLTIAEWSKRSGLSHTVIRGRLRRGLRPEDAVSAPLNSSKSHKRSAP